MRTYLPAGNEQISLPGLNDRGGIESLTFLTMAHRGMLELHGGDSEPLMRPFVEVDGAEAELRDFEWRREHHWIPSARAKAGEHVFELCVLAPVGERGFALRLRFTASAGCRIRWGLRGLWAGSRHCVNEAKPVEGSVHCWMSGWNHGPVFDMRVGVPLFALAPMCTREFVTEHELGADGLSYRLSLEDGLGAGERCECVFFWGLGYEEVAAATSAKELLRRGWDWEYDRNARWLDARARSFASEKLTELYNLNLFFCIFYSTGRTLDTEELVCCTSRSTRYYVSAAYWDRDSLLWSFPAILDADAELARELLAYVFGRQRRNIGVHSRYIDGTVLEPGFELDELVSPVLALERYLGATGDRGILSDAEVLKGLELIVKRLAAERHPETALYSTFLQPTDDEIVYPYLTYDNVLVWRALLALAELLPERYAGLRAEAELVRAAVYEHCVFDGMFAWSVDLEGRHNIYDEPPGSLQLLPYYGFCSGSDEVWRKTAAHIRSPEYEYSFAGESIAEIGCAHAPYPWLLSLCNSLLSGHADTALAELERMGMDNGIACESVYPDTGECATGAAFATCAGFLCHALKEAADA